MITFIISLYLIIVWFFLFFSAVRQLLGDRCLRFDIDDDENQSRGGESALQLNKYSYR